MSIARVFVLGVALVTCAVGAAEMPPVVPTAADLAGLYVLSSQPGTAHHLVLDADGTFAATLITSRPPALSPVRGHWTVDAAGLLRLKYFNGESIVPVVATCAVVDGHLWVGVFRKTKHPKRDEWVMETRNVGVFGTLAQRAPDCRILWLMDAGTWTCTSPQRQPGGDSVARCAGIRVVRAPASKPPDMRLLPLFPKTISFPKLSAYLGHGTHLGAYTVVPLGILGDPQWSMASAAGAFKPPLTQRDAFRKLVDMQSRGVSEHSPIHGTWEQRGNAILTPWSLDLGPAAVVPLKKNFPKLAGQWKSVENADKRIKIIVDLGKGKTPVAPLPQGRPTPERLRTLFDTATFRPGADGVSVVRWGWDCVAGHQDVPGHIVSCITKDGRFVRWIYPGGCHGMFPRPGPARAEVFVRVQQ